MLLPCLASKSWSVERVQRWLENEELLPFQTIFRQFHVDGDMLRRLSDRHLVDMGASISVHQLRILTKVEALLEAGSVLLVVVDVITHS